MAVIGIFTNENGDSIEFSKESGIRITSWGGLTSNSADIDESSTINQIGTSITGTKVQSKPHTIEGRYKYQHDLRNSLLSIVLPGCKGQLRYINTESGIDVYWDVIVTTSPEISHGYYYQDFQFVVKAGYPYPKNSNQKNLDFSPLVSLFSFPRTYVTGEKFKISERQFSPLKTIINEGTIESGFTITMKANTSGIAGPYVIDIDTQNIISLPSLTMNLGDELIICTKPNESYCHLISDGEETNVYGLTTFESTFFKLKPGINNIRYGATTNESRLDAIIEYDTIRAGV